MPVFAWLGRGARRVGVAAVVGVGVAALACYVNCRRRGCAVAYGPSGITITQLQNLCWRSRPHMNAFQCLLRLLGGPLQSNTVVVLRTANPNDAELYRTLLLPLQQQLKFMFTVVVEAVDGLDKVLVVEARTGSYHNERASAHTNTHIEDDPKGYGKGSAFSNADTSNVSPAFTEGDVAASVASASLVDYAGEASILCRIPLPDQRVYRDIPSTVPRLIAAHTANARLFSSYAEEMLFYLPFIEEFNKNHRESQQKQHHHLMTPTATATMLSPVGVQDGCMEGSRDGEWPSPVDDAVAGVSKLHARFEDWVISMFLGHVIDINATMFSTSLLAEFGDLAIKAGSDGNSIFKSKGDQFIYNTIHEALFHVLLRTPFARPDASAIEKLRMHPFKVWHISRRSRRVTAELYVLDVVAAKSDPVICDSRVVDEVVAQAVLVHHSGSLVEFVDVLQERFGLVYVPIVPALRRVVMRRLRVNGRREQLHQHDEWHDAAATRSFADGADDLPPDDEEEEKRDDVLQELPHVTGFILEHRIAFYNAMLTTSGSNQLEEVFGVPATVFPFLQCARGSVAFVTEVFDCIVSAYGPLNFHNFTKYAHDVFVRDHPEIVRHAPRIFRMLNKTRTGVISFEELCCWMARKVSSGSLLRPDAHLIAIAMSLRLPLALLVDKKQHWCRKECALESLLEADVDGY